MPTGFFDNNAYLAVERKLGKRISVQVDAGYMVITRLAPYPYEVDSKLPNYNIKTEFRVYFKKTCFKKWYSAFQIIYRETNYPIEDEICLQWEQNVSDTDSYNCFIHEKYKYNIQRRVVYFNFKIGRQWNVAKGFLFDLYAGLGIRFIKSIHQNKKEGIPDPSPYNFDESPAYEFPVYITEFPIEESGTAPNALFGFKLGYLF